MPVASMSARWAAARRTPSASNGCLAPGATAEQIASIHAPIGLDIGAASPAEIAVAVLAEIIQRAAHARRRPPAAEGRSGVKFGPVAIADADGRDPRACDRCRRQALSQGASASRPWRHCRARSGRRRRGRGGASSTTDDLGEDEAAARLRRALQPTASRSSPPRPAGSTCMPGTAGVFTADRALIDAINRVDPAITHRDRRRNTRQSRRARWWQRSRSSHSP